MIASDDRRVSSRIDACGDYLIRQGLSSHEPCVLKNISVTGACIQAESELAVDQLVELHVCSTRDVALRSKVVWIKGTDFGLSFMLDTPESFNEISFIMNSQIRR